MKQVWWLWIIWLGLTSCSFDQDLAYYPRTLGAYFIVVDSLGSRHLMAVEGDGYAERAVAGGAPLTGLDSRAGTLWVGAGDQARAYHGEGDRLQAAEVLDCAPLQPAYLCAGDRYLLVADTASARLGFVSLRNGEVFLRALPAPPGQPVYRSGKFFVPVGGQKVHIWQEVALAVVDSVTLAHRIVDIQIEPRTVLWVHTRDDSSLYAASLDYNTHQIVAAEAPLPFDHLQRSPFLWQNFGKELLGRVSLQGGVLRPGNFREVRAVATDFFEGELYYVQADSLHRYRPRDRVSQVLGAFSGEIQRAVFLLPKSDP